jgi:hypothetical protein
MALVLLLSRHYVAIFFFDELVTQGRLDGKSNPGFNVWPKSLDTETSRYFFDKLLFPGPVGSKAD